MYSTAPIDQQSSTNYAPAPPPPAPTPLKAMEQIVLGEHFLAITGSAEAMELLPQSHTLLLSCKDARGGDVVQQTRIYRLPPGMPIGTWTIRGYKITNEGVAYGYADYQKPIIPAPRGLLRYLCQDRSFESLAALAPSFIPQDWLIPGLIPDKAVSVLYGRGGIGKTTWLAWATAQVSSRGKNVAVLLVEEHLSRFAAMVQLMGGDLQRVYSMENAGEFVIPRDKNILAQAIAHKNIDFVAIDSIYAHFAEVGGNAAEKARTCMTALSDIAIGWGIAICGMYHENKAGAALGSVEIPNVARHVLHATSDANLTIGLHVEKSNRGVTGAYRLFNLQAHPLLNEQGEQYFEYNMSGERTPAMILAIA